MKRTIYITICTLIISLGIAQSTSFAQTKEIEMQSYHISPTDSYKHILLVPQQRIETGGIAIGTSCGSDKIGTLYYSSEPIGAEAFYFCNRDPIDSQERWFPPSGIWEQINAAGKISLFEQSSINRTDIKVGIGTSNPEWKLSLDNDGGILSLGTEDPNTQDFSLFTTTIAPADSDYAMFLWYSKKGALHAQKTDITADFWTEDNIGIYSTALGRQSQARKFASFAAGYKAIADGPLSSTFGAYNNIYTETDLLPTDKAIVLSSAILGGVLNVITGDTDNEGPAGNIIGAGYGSRITDASLSAIMGGYTNKIDGGMASNFSENSTNINTPDDRTHSLVIGGWQNIIDSTGKGNAIAGGAQNKISGTSNYSSIISGGPWSGPGIVSNEISDSDYSLIGAGTKNTITTSSHYSVIGNGYLGTINIPSLYAILLNSTSVSGSDAEISGNYSSLGIGKQGPYIDGDYTTVMGSYDDDLIKGNFNFIGATSNTFMDGEYSVIFAGNSAELYGEFSMAHSIGRIGTSLPNYSNYSIAHGNAEINDGDFVWLFNGDDTTLITNNGNRNFIWGWGDHTIANTTTDSFLLLGDGGNPMAVGIGTSSIDVTTNNRARLAVNGIVRTSTFSLGTPAAAVAGVGLGVAVDGETIERLDLAEEFNTKELVEPGDVLVINNDNSGNLSKSRLTYDKNVIGVVSSNPALTFANGGITNTSTNNQAKTLHPAVALTGRVPIKVSTENGPIEPGDLLTTSSVPGTAMKATDNEQLQHAVVGKALETFNKKEPGKVLAIILLR